MGLHQCGRRSHVHIHAAHLRSHRKPRPCVLSDRHYVHDHARGHFAVHDVVLGALVFIARRATLEGLAVVVRDGPRLAEDAEQRVHVFDDAAGLEVRERLTAAEARAHLNLVLERNCGPCSSMVATS